MGILDRLFGRKREPINEHLEEVAASKQTMEKLNPEKLEENKNVEGLIELLEGEDRDIQDRALDALVRIGEPAVEPLIRILEDTYSYDNTRSLAATALGTIGTPAINPLIESLKKWQTNSRKFACEAFVKMGSKGVEPLINYIKTNYKSENDCDGPVSALCMIKEPAVEPLINTLKDSNPHVAAKAAYILGEIGDARAISPLLTFIVNADKKVRVNSIEALGRFANIDAIGPILQNITDKDGKIREMTLWSLSFIILRLKSTEANTLRSSLTTPLLKALSDPYSGVRREAATALGHLGDVRTIDALKKCLKDSDEEVRENAEWALEQIQRDNATR